ncbi:cellulase family glycosylhydrolase [Planomonospora parontospora]|uniref:cellulase family glycosylhydrolase n=1 Tax=Planomonospora parontospora TaxID=58119 RepID=UPI001E63907C|nr:cellulase family glycosylhydrolase [Planomonospora parontospora]
MRAASFRVTRRAASALAVALASTLTAGSTGGPTVAASTTAAASATGPSATSATGPSAARISLTVAAKQQSRVFRDGDGREVTLRGFNVSGSTKLYENSLLPFRSTADAARSAQAMRDLTGANVIRFLISWEGVQPSPSTIDHAYLDRAVEQIREFTRRGIRVLVDYHQDLYSSHLFHEDSWYTGDGAPEWVVKAGGYPRESCGICFLWGQNMQTNEAVRQAARDFWRDRRISTPEGEVGVQEAFLRQATAAMTRIRQRLPEQDFAAVIGFDPFNEPYDGGLDGRSGLEWEKTYLMPFYQRFRAAMDTAGWAGKPAFVEPLVFWNTGFFEEGGLTTVGALGTGYVFNSHFYDGARMTIDPSPASDGVYGAAMNEIRDRARTLATAPFVSEFGHKLSGNGSDRTPWMVRAMYQAMDSGVPGKNWWRTPAAGGDVLSSTQWHWDLYSGRHREVMNRDPAKVRTEGDAWNDEDFSVVAADASGALATRLDRAVLDRLYPSAVAGDVLAFTYEDLARSGYGGAGQQRAWLAVPSSMPNIAALVKDRRFGVLVWREPAATPGAPTELHLPASFTAATTVVVGDVATRAGLPASGPAAIATETGSSTAHRLLLSPSGAAPGTVHAALVVGAATGPAVTPAQLAAAAAELAAWKEQRFPT